MPVITGVYILESFEMKLMAIFSICTGIVLGACGDGGLRDDDDDDSSQRFGDEVSLEAYSKYDARPSISADGNRIVFLSGRDNVLRAYKYDASEEDAAPARVSADDDDGLTQEIDAKVSPDGNWVLIVGVVGNQVDLFLKPYNGNGAAVKLTDDTAVESQIGFSSDSAMFSYTSRNGSVNSLAVGQLDSNGLDGSLVAIDESEGESISALVTLTAGSSYSLVSQYSEASSFTTTLRKRTLTVAGESISASSSSTALEDARVENAAMVAGSDNVAFVVANPRGDDATAAIPPVEVKDGDDEEINVFRIAKSLAVSDNTQTGLGLLGYDVLSASQSLVAAGSSPLGVFVQREVYACGTTEYDYGTGLVLYDLDQEQPERVTVISGTEGGTFEVSAGPCEKERADGSEGGFDRRILSAVVSADSTTSAYSIAYVSYISNDNEVYLLSFDGTDYEVTNISSNKE